MRNWIGLGSLIAGAWLLYVAWAQRNRVLAAERLAALRGENLAATPLHPSLVAARNLFRPIILLALPYLGVKTTLAYMMSDGERVFSLFDLAGFLFLLASYGAWIVVKTKYRGNR